MADTTAIDTAPLDQPVARQADPCRMVIFGAAGDLTRRLLVPAIYNLAAEKLLPDAFMLFGIARAAKDTETFRRELGDAVRTFANCEVSGEAWEWLSQRTHYLRGDFDDPATFKALTATLAERPHATRAPGTLFYLATRPDAFGPIVRRLAAEGLLDEAGGGWRRVIVEKPFGHDLASARALNRELLSVLREDQIHRIDHYLGKETVQNIMVFRFANGIFEPIWNRDHIDHAQITVAETVGVERRGTFYDATGALRDMVPNHVFQLLAMTAMEAPNSFHADDVRSEKTKVLGAIKRLRPEDVASKVVRAQYGASIIDGKPVPAYREEPNVAPDSTTETCVALRLMIDNWRWAGVPFYLRTGKRLAQRKTEIAIRFKPAPFALFEDTPVERLTPNWLTLRIQPDEGVALQFGAKVPAPTMRLGKVKMDFHYKDYFDAAPRTGYETLIYDCMIGDATRFQRADTIEAGWSVVQPILDAWQHATPAGIPTYPAGSEGPREADELLQRDGRAWREII